MICGVAGHARSGKNVFAEFLQECFLKKYQIEFRFDAFANELKKMCIKHFGLTRDQLWGNEKERMLRHGKNELGRLGLSSNPADYWTPREIMQALGAFYRTIDYDFWVKKLDENFYKLDPKDVIITDIRHVNECEYVKQSNGILLKIVRDRVENIHGMTHESEVSLDDKPDNYFDLVVDNNGSLDDLRDAVPNIVEAIMVLNKLKEEGRDYNAKR